MKTLRHSREDRIVATIFFLELTLLVLFIVGLSVRSTYAQTNCSGGCGTVATSVLGTTTNDSAAAGYVGEIISATVTSGSAVTVATGSATPITSISLTAGDWDVSGTVDYVPNAATSVTTLAQGAQSLNGCMTNGPALGSQDTFSLWETAANIIGASNPAWQIPTSRISITSTTTVCLIAKASFSVNSLTAYGTIRARRIR